MISFPNWYACHPICTGCAHRRCNGSSADVDVSRLTQVCVCVCGGRGGGRVGVCMLAHRARRCVGGGTIVLLWHRRAAAAAVVVFVHFNRKDAIARDAGAMCSLTLFLSLSLSPSACVVLCINCAVWMPRQMWSNTHTHSYMYVMQFSTLSPFAIYTLYTWAAWQYRGADVHACTRINNLVRRSLLLLLVVGSGLAGRGTGSPTFMLYNM